MKFRLGSVYSAEPMPNVAFVKVLLCAKHAFLSPAYNFRPILFCSLLAKCPWKALHNYASCVCNHRNCLAASVSPRLCAKQDSPSNHFRAFSIKPMCRDHIRASKNLYSNVQ